MNHTDFFDLYENPRTSNILSIKVSRNRAISVVHPIMSEKEFSNIKLRPLEDIQQGNEDSDNTPHLCHSPAEKSRNAVKIGKARKKLALEEAGPDGVHPITTDKFSNPKNITEENKAEFCTLLERYILYLARRNCYSISSRSSTSCTCVKDIINDVNVKDVALCLYSHFKDSKTTQLINIKKYIRGAKFLRQQQTNSSKGITRTYRLPGVFCDLPVNEEPAFICQHAMLSFFSLGYWRFLNLRRDLENPELKVHGNAGKICNRHKGKEWIVMKAALHEFFSRLQDEAEARAKSEIQAKTGFALKEVVFDFVELSSIYSKRNLYTKFCWERGYAPKATSKGNLGSTKSFPLRPFDSGPNAEWPEGSIPKPLCSRTTFNNFWKKYYPRLKLKPRPPSKNTQVDL